MNTISLEGLNSLDYVFLTVLAICLIRGFWRGGAVILFNTAGFFAGFLVAIHSFNDLGKLIHTLVPSLSKPDLLAFIALFFLTWFVIGGVGHWVSTLFTLARMKFLDRLLGALIGLVLALIVLASIFSTLTLLLPPTHPLLRESQLAPYVSKTSSTLYAVVSRHIGKELEHRQKMLRQYWDEQVSRRSP